MKVTIKPILIALTAVAMSVASAAQAAKQTIAEIAASNKDFSTLVAALKAADLVDAVNGKGKGKGKLTVFAPTNAAFAKLPKGTVETLLKPENKAKLQAVLKFHVVAGTVKAGDLAKANYATTLQGQRVDASFEGGKLSVNGAKVVTANIEASNGVVHVIDTVILPESKDIIDTAVANKDFAILFAAVQAAGLGEALKGEGPFTVLAPTNAAFNKLPKGTVESLLKPENKSKLQAILKYHVIPARVYSDAASNGATVKTLQGQTVTTGIKDGQLTINGAKVIATDIEVSNGVVHAIDMVLLPEAASAKTSPAKMIEEAINKGVPVFNRGHHSQCATIYANTMKVLTKDERVSKHDRMMLTRVLKRGESTHSSTSRAWMFRRALDQVHSNMAETAGR